MQWLKKNAKCAYSLYRPPYESSKKFKLKDKAKINKKKRRSKGIRRDTQASKRECAANVTSTRKCALPGSRAARPFFLNFLTMLNAAKSSHSSNQLQHVLNVLSFYDLTVDLSR
jgi:hypothetical protein